MNQKRQKLLLGVATQTRPEIGGGNVYEQSALSIIKEALPSNWDLVHIEKSDLTQQASKFAQFGFGGKSQRRLFRKLPSEATVERFNEKIRALDLVIFLSPSYGMNSLKAFPFVTTVWDLGPIELAGLKEFSGNYQEKFISNLQKEVLMSFRIIVDSTQTKGKLSKLFGASDERIRVGGLPLPRLTPVRPRDLSLPQEYFVYPSRFWAHKNHLTLLEALAQAVELNSNLHLVLTGIQPEKAGALSQLVSDWGLSGHVSVLGFLPRNESLYLIKNARALVMPTLLGPTNYPPLEALELGTPSILSDAHQFDFEVPSSWRVVPAQSPQAWATALLDPPKSPQTTANLQTAQHYKQEFLTILSEFEDLRSLEIEPNKTLDTFSKD